MILPERFMNLPDYAFPRLRTLLKGVTPEIAPQIDMSIGSPRHDMPAFTSETMIEHVDRFQGYPPNEGAPEVLDAISNWLKRRYSVDIAHDRLLLLNGSREGLFNAALALCPEHKAGKTPKILIPNPFYQVYAAAALAVGAEPYYVDATQATHHLPDFAGLPKDVLDQTAILYICSPANPQGAVASADYLTDLLELAEQHDFLIFSDECYSEIYSTTPPPGILEVATAQGIDPERVVAFNSLSKRSNLAGLRVGFAASGPKAIAQMRRLRAYGGAPIPYPLQMIAARAWDDEDHVVASRALYTQKRNAANDILGGIDSVDIPEAGFFLWLPVEDGETAARTLWQTQGIRVLPGSFLARTTHAGNPGKTYIRVALVGPLDETKAALQRLRHALYPLN